MPIIDDCVNCQCAQRCCYRYCDYDALRSQGCGCVEKILVVGEPNQVFPRGTPLALLSDGTYGIFDPNSTQTERTRFAGLIARNWQTDDNGYGIFQDACQPHCGRREVEMFLSGLYLLSDLNLTADQVAGIVAQGAGRVLGDVNSMRGYLYLY